MYGYCFTGARRPLRGALLTAGVLAGALCAGAASADEATTMVTKILTPVIEIESDGKVYTKPAIALTPVSAVANIDLDAGISGHIKSYKVWLMFRTQNSGWAKFPQHAKSQSFPIGERPKAINTDILINIPYGSHASYLIAYCNLQANALRNGGMSDKEIFSQDRPIQVGIHSEVEAKMSGAKATGSVMALGGGWDIIPKMTVLCKAKEPERKPADTADKGPQRKDTVLQSLSLMIIPKDSLHGACALQLAGTVKTKQPNTQAKFRFESDDGHKSDVKTVQTGSVATRQYAYDYPLSPGGTRSGRIRVVAVGENVASDWKDYAVTCGSPAQDVAAVLPPKITALQIIPTGEEVMHQGRACPAKVKIYGVMKGRGTVSGAAALFADSKLKKLQQYAIKDGQTLIVQGEHALAWGPGQSQQNLKFAMNLSNKAADLVDHREMTQNFTCRAVKVNPAVQPQGGGLSGQPKQPLGGTALPKAPAKPKAAPVILLPGAVK